MNTHEVIERTDKVINQVVDMVDKIYEEGKAVDFSKDISEKDLALIKLHLGYSKNYSDLAKVRLQYSKI